LLFAGGALGASAQEGLPPRAGTPDNNHNRPIDPALPTIFIAGDSTAQTGEPNAVGWGKMFGDYFDLSKVNVINRSIGGRSSRTFVSEGRWDRLVADLKPGDTVLIQFGQNDGAAKNGPRVARGSLPGLGEETEEIDNIITKKHEVLHTFGWYERKMISETLAKGARPILLTLTVHDTWTNGKIDRVAGKYNEWMRALAASEKVDLVDFTKLAADRLDRMGREAANGYFPRDHVHTDEDGARFNATVAVSGLKGLRDQSIIRLLSLSGRMVPTASPDAVWLPQEPPPHGAEPAVFTQWLNLPTAADPAEPTVYLIGDSTVRNGRGDGYDGQFGWGDPLEKYFYPSKANLVNRAVGGTGARTFMKQWQTLLPLLKKGDVVIMQFGHNDNGARGALNGIGEETEVRNNAMNKDNETVHTFGWYLRAYVADIQGKGATPVICSLVPRNRWADGKIVQTDLHADWARAVATAGNVAFIDLNGLLAARYNDLGQDKTTALFADKTTHTTWEGAELTAEVVDQALRALPQDPVALFLRPGM
jgi:lysophospholipase L1-like esterase